MDTSTLTSMISIAGLALGFVGYMRDKMRAAEQMGQLREKVRSLEAQQLSNNAKFSLIDEKLDKINQCLSRVEAFINTLNS